MSEWNGMPPNEQYRGWHWLYLYNGLPIPAYWDDHWLINGQQIKAEDLNPEIKYWGQCLTPSEIEAKNARIAKLEAALRRLDDMIVDLDAGHRELHEVSRFINGALAGWKR